MREVKIQTNAIGSGLNYAHPAQPNFDNPIIAAHESTDHVCYLNFENKDGQCGTHSSGNRPTQTRKQITPADSVITKIKVWHNDCLRGFKCFNKDNTVVLEVGLFDSSQRTEIIVQEGERLL